MHEPRELLLTHLERLSNLSAVSGREGPVRDYILENISKSEAFETDALGNLLVYKKGRARAERRILLDAHMDEVGLMVTAVGADGFLRVAPIGGIDAGVLPARRVRLENGRLAVVCAKPVHLRDKEETAPPDWDSLFLDLGGDPQASVKPGDVAVFDSVFRRMGSLVRGKAIDDRAGCAILLTLLQSDAPYDFTACFSVNEETGVCGAQTAAFRAEPDTAVILEATTAADLPGVEEDARVCTLGGGPAISFLDGGALYDPALYRAVFELAQAQGIPCQPKAAATGGNNARGIGGVRTGVRCLALSVPCRYLHAPHSVADPADLESAFALTAVLTAALCSGRL